VNIDTTLVIPAYNEEHRLGRTLDLYWHAMRTRGLPFEIIVVANGCQDATAMLARAMRQQMPEIHVVEISQAIGKGKAVLSGFQRASGNKVIFADADAATSANSLIALLDALDEYDVAIGSRRLPQSAILTPQPLSRRLLGSLFAATVRILFPLPFADTQCGAKAFRRDVARHLTSTVEESGWVFDVDLLLNAHAYGARIKEVPVVWRDVAGSKVRVMSTAVEVLAAFWRLKRGSVVKPSLQHSTADSIH
jgi:dolichyl-phosphate beta-glucosyltransferase